MNLSRNTIHIINYLFITVANKFGIISTTFIYSYFLTIDDFGKYNLYSAFLWIFGLLLTLNLSTAFGRYLYETEAKIDEFFSTLIICIFLSFSVFVILFFVLSPQLDLYFSLSLDLIVCLVLVNLGVPFDTFYAQKMYKNRNSKGLLNYSIIKVILLSLLSVCFIQIFDRKYIGLIAAEVVISISFAIYVLYRLDINFKFRVDTKHLSYMARYSLPLLPYMLCSTLLTQSDRIIIGHYFTDYDIGIYSMAYNLGLLMTLFFTSVLNFWNPNLFENLNNRNYDYIVKDSFFLFNLAAFAILVFNFFSGYIFSVILPTNFSLSIALIPVVGLCSLAAVIWSIFGSVIGYSNKTHIVSLIFIIGTSLNIILNIILLPKFGYPFALYTTFIAYSVISYLGLSFSNRRLKLYKIDIPYIFLMLLLVSAFSIIFLIVDLNIWVAISSKIIISLLFLFLLQKKYKTIEKTLFKL